ncbi:MAG: hypothetical protein CMG62_08675 [Candidatus Marinimicrobia bacterium]|nr:hypothetical protein [Candidatus Neomarinimicrobiota bacterium]
MVKTIYKRKLSYSFVIFTSLIISCGEDVIEVPEPDRTPPVATIISPVHGDTIFENTLFKVHATDNDKVESIVFIVNEDTLGTVKNKTDDVFEKLWKADSADSDGNRIFPDDLFHSLSFVAVDPAGNQFRPYPIRVKIDITDNLIPEGYIIYPYMGAVLEGTVPIQINASDNDSVKYVKVYINDFPEGYVQTPPYTYNWNTVYRLDGSYSIRAEIADVSDNIFIIEPFVVTLNNGNIIDTEPPTGSIIYPAAGMIVSGTIDIQVSAYDNGEIDNVEFFIDGSSHFVDQETPYQYAWDTTQDTSDGIHIITTIITDKTGNETTINPITVTSNNWTEDDITPPNVAIISPASGQEVSGTINIIAEASDNLGVAFVKLMINGESQDTDYDSPYSFPLNTENLLEDEEYIIGAIAEDLAGNNFSANPIAVLVNNFDNEAPVGQIVYPYPGQSVSDTINIQVVASDNVGVSSVSFTINGDLVSEDTDPPYEYEWDTIEEAEDEDHIIQASISDTSNNLTELLPISVTVDNIDPVDNIPPTGIISNPLSGQEVSGTVLFRVNAQDNVGVLSVEFLIDGASVYIDSSETYLYEWDTSQLENNSEHTLSAKVTDTSQNTSNLQPIMVIISN